MTKRDKLLDKVRNNPKAVTFDELVKLLTWYDFSLRRVKGSHHIYVRGACRITVVWRRPHVDPEAVLEVIDSIDDVESGNRRRSLGE